MKGQFEILNSLKENGFENLNTFRSIRVHNFGSRIYNAIYTTESQ